MDNICKNGSKLPNYKFNPSHIEVQLMIDELTFYNMNTKKHKILRNHKETYSHNGDHIKMVERIKKMDDEELEILSIIYSLYRKKEIVNEVIEEYDIENSFPFSTKEPINEKAGWTWIDLLVSCVTKSGPKYINRNYRYFQYLIEEKGYWFNSQVKNELRKRKITSLIETIKK